MNRFNQERRRGLKPAISDETMANSPTERALPLTIDDLTTLVGGLREEFYGEAFLQIRGRKITNPTPGDLWSNCESLSRALRRTLSPLGVSTGLVESADVAKPTKHLYLLHGNKSSEILIDPSHRQILVNLNGIFVGTREMLRAVVMSPATEIVKSFSYLPREEIFQQFWGMQSRPRYKGDQNYS